ncbi:hypothetical protein GOP80_07535 [Planococcaceae bacterium Storch 2/2-2]|nr:hypothetical protein [Planococcaceae bacterium Storch 2/2-2]
MSTGWLIITLALFVMVVFVFYVLVRLLKEADARAKAFTRDLQNLSEQMTRDGRTRKK